MTCIVAVAILCTSSFFDMPPEERQNRSTANPDVGTKEYAEALHSWCTVAHINHIDEIVGPRFCKDQRAVCPDDFIHIGKLLEILMNPPYSCTNAMVFPNKFEQAVLKFLAEKPLKIPTPMLTTLRTPSQPTSQLCSANSDSLFAKIDGHMMAIAKQAHSGENAKGMTFL